MNKYIKKRIGRIVRLETNDNNLIKHKLNKYLISIDKVIDLPMQDGKYLKQVDYTYYSPISYENLVVDLIRKQYSINEELAILRKSNVATTDEFHIYNAYVEECKVRAKTFIAERESAVNE